MWKRREHQINAYLETLSDTLGAAGVIVTGILVLVYKFYLADPIVSIRLAVFMLTRTWTITIIIHNMRDLNWAISFILQAILERSYSILSFTNITKFLIAIVSLVPRVSHPEWDLTDWLHRRPTNSIKLQLLRHLRNHIRRINGHQPSRHKTIVVIGANQDK